MYGYVLLSCLDLKNRKSREYVVHERRKYNIQKDIVWENGCPDKSHLEHKSVDMSHVDVVPYEHKDISHHL